MVNIEDIEELKGKKLLDYEYSDCDRGYNLYSFIFEDGTKLIFGYEDHEGSIKIEFPTTSEIPTSETTFNNNFELESTDEDGKVIQVESLAELFEEYEPDRIKHANFIIIDGCVYCNWMSRR